ncbi:DUF1704 domain-containing protein [Aggregatimonas sangjinii]|uniref:DUF1704 domain-containing protein n=1 Tax=Aggregatimonas sangjinii TaxID=2583587 RepID=A0A5B7SN95_9FLAO|nr:tyrosine/phenylalanine carboxypeptidase domain-containing protein [Aggregatimonas sangjinii]QCW99986.1 DUF1704 domain-containing protein [Aggregatimonas sangjinii]
MIQKKTVQSVCKKLLEERTVNQKLPKDGILHIDKLLPYICVYRYKEVDPYFSGLLKTQASYLIIEDSIDITVLLEQIARTISKKLKAFLILESWPLRANHQSEFVIHCQDDKIPATISALEKGFAEMREIYPETSVQVVDSSQRHPQRLEELMGSIVSKESACMVVGIAVPTLYERREENEVYSLFYRKFHSKFSEVIKRAAYEFVRVQTTNPFNHYLMLGKTNLDGITLKADRELATISEGMSFLLRTTPVNSTSEWRKFEKNGFSKNPSFNYRLITIDPEKKKRKLYDIPLDKVEDPTLAFILRDKRLEIEKQLTMLEERGTDNFRFIGESLYGKIAPEVLHAGRKILEKHPTGEDPEVLKKFDCHQFAERAKDEMDYYQSQFPDLKLSLEIRKDVAGIMVSKTKLLINDQFSMDADRCDALIQHEIATHILTYCNGKGQPLRQMYAGFAGYDQLQEGLAVLAEYLVDGLTVNRMRLLAARVVAVDSLVSGVDFIKTFELLREQHNFPDRVAYYITMRVYRGGGLVKDAVYLAGLMNVLEYLGQGGKLETLYTGKFNITHVELIEELLHRGVLKYPTLPRFLERDAVKKRLKKVSEGISVTDLLD